MEDEEWKRSSEGIKTTIEWSKWLVTIQTGVITLIGAAIKFGDSQAYQKPIIFPVCAAVACLAASICFASGTILWASGLLQHKSFGADLRIFKMSDDRHTVERKISNCVFWQYWTFFYGIIFFAAAVIVSAFLPHPHA